MKVTLIRHTSVAVEKGVCYGQTDVPVATTNGESYPMVYKRLASFLDELKAKDYKHVAIFAHCGILLCAGIYAGLFPEEGCFEHAVDYGGIEEIEI